MIIWVIRTVRDDQHAVFGKGDICHRAEYRRPVAADDHRRQHDRCVAFDPHPLRVSVVWISPAQPAIQRLIERRVRDGLARIAPEQSRAGGRFLLYHHKILPIRRQTHVDVRAHPTGFFACAQGGNQLILSQGSHRRSRHAIHRSIIQLNSECAVSRGHPPQVQLHTRQLLRRSAPKTLRRPCIRVPLPKREVATNRSGKVVHQDQSFIHCTDRERKGVGAAQSRRTVIRHPEGDRVHAASLRQRRRPADAPRRRHRQPGRTAHQGKTQVVGRHVRIARCRRSRIRVQRRNHPIRRHMQQRQAVHFVHRQHKTLRRAQRRHSVIRHAHGDGVDAAPLRLARRP